MANIKPLVLLVEDEPKERERRSELLQVAGFAAIAVGSAEEAEHELRGAPGIDLLVTDINLDPQSSRDRSGVVLAKKTSVLFPDLPVVAYSARVEQGDLSESDRSVFKDSILKGGFGIRQLKGKFDVWLKIAIQHHTQRRDFVKKELDRLVAKYTISEYDFELLREFIPIAQGLPLSSDARAESVLAEAGFTLKMIGPLEANLLLKSSDKKPQRSHSVSA